MDSDVSKYGKTSTLDRKLDSNLAVVYVIIYSNIMHTRLLEIIPHLAVYMQGFCVVYQ